MQTTHSKRFFVWLEISFWNAAIPLLSDSSALRKLAAWGHAAYKNYRTLPRLLKLSLWALLGWTLGLSIGWVTALLLP